MRPLSNIIAHDGEQSMTSRERVLKAFRKTKGLPDRVPVQFDLCKQLLEYFSTRYETPVHYTRNLFEDVTYRISGNEIRTRMGSDVVITGASEIPDALEYMGDGTWFNEYGMRMKQGDVYVEVTDFPLDHVKSISDVAAYSFPDPSNPRRYRDAESIVQKYHDEYLVFADIEVTIFSLAMELVGMEKLLIDMATDAEYIEPLFRRCADFQIEIGLRLIEAGVDALWAGDDFGSQSGLLISPEMFKTMLKPYYKRMTDAFKRAKPDIILIFHSDGAVGRLLDDIHEVGFEVFNPLQPGVPGHGPEELKDNFGNKLAFWGGIDQQHLLPYGTDDDLEKTVKDMLDILGRNGGYMIAPAHIIQADVSPERVEHFIDLCKKHGSYT
jgi:uroporphyrinogen decarboxylase